MGAHGLSFAPSSSAHAGWIAANVGLRWRFVAGIPWVIDLDAFVPLRVPSVRARNSAGEYVYRDPRPLGALLSVGPAWVF
jgi:hypothetical protein